MKEVTKPFPFPDCSSEKPKDVSETPRRTVLLPLLSSPPCLDISSVHTAGFQSKRDCLQERGKLTSFWGKACLVQQHPWSHPYQ